MDILIIETIYTLIVLACSLYIFFRTAKLFELSGHSGIKSFRNAFFFWIMTYSVRYILLYFDNLYLTVFFNYALTMAGFFLVYSLVWKNFTENREYILHGLAVLIAVVSIYFVYLIYIAQIVVLLYAIMISYSNYKFSKKHNFLQLYFISLVLALIGYLANLAAMFIVQFYPPILLYAYGLTAGVFVIFVFGVMSVWPGKESA